METEKILMEVYLTAHFSPVFSGLQILTISKSLSELKDMQSTYLLRVLSQRYSEITPEEN